MELELFIYIRVYKGDWENIHDFIEGTWKYAETPTTMIRHGDPEELYKKELQYKRTQNGL